MTPEAGWYPDPAGTPGLRYWDGQTWTSALAPAPAPQPVAAAVASPMPGTTLPRPTPSRSARRRSKLYAVTAGVVAVAVAATAIPLALSGGDSPRTNGAFAKALLSAPEVDAAANGTFAIEPDDNSGDATPTSGCVSTKAIETQLFLAGKAHVDRSYADRREGLFVAEMIDYTPGAAATFSSLTKTLNSCHTITIGGDTALALTTSKGLPVTGSDESLSISATGPVSGRTVTMVIKLARFGDCVIGVIYAGDLGSSVSSSDTGEQLLAAAAYKATAKHAF